MKSDRTLSREDRLNVKQLFFYLDLNYRIFYIFFSRVINKTKIFQQN